MERTKEAQEGSQKTSHVIKKGKKAAPPEE